MISPVCDPLQCETYSEPCSLRWKPQATNRITLDAYPNLIVAVHDVIDLLTPLGERLRCPEHRRIALRQQ